MYVGALFQLLNNPYSLPHMGINMFFVQYNQVTKVIRLFYSRRVGNRYIIHLRSILANRTAHNTFNDLRFGNSELKAMVELLGLEPHHLLSYEFGWKVVRYYESLDGTLASIL